MHTGFDLRLRGWRLKYVPVIYAIGVCPPHITSFVAQQYRWCMGSMSLLGSAKFWKAKQPLRTRLCYLCGFSYYVHTALFTFIGPVIPLLLLSFHSETVKLRNYVWILPGVVYSLVLFPLWHRQSYRLEAWAVKMIYGWAHALALADILLGTRRGWQPTGGRESSQGGIGRRVWWGIGLWGGGVAAAWIALASGRSPRTGGSTSADPPLWRVLRAGRRSLSLVDPCEAPRGTNSPFDLAGQERGESPVLPTACGADGYIQRVRAPPHTISPARRAIPRERGDAGGQVRAGGNGSDNVARPVPHRHSRSQRRSRSKRDAYR